MAMGFLCGNEKGSSVLICVLDRQAVTTLSNHVLHRRILVFTLSQWTP